ncbi:MAG: iron-containing alcohol dehydrogenase [Alicyclobacillus sp.]|nr:iron-containing alcohol dehydrogenase [Alicyclobacillus sp.]
MLNIGCVEYGNGALKRLKDIVNEKTLILTQPEPWRAVSEKVTGLDPGKVTMVTSVHQDDLDKLAEESDGFARVIGVGGGMSLDAAKYISWKTGMALSQVPTIISTNAFATEAIGVRLSDGNVRYVGKAFADNIIVDFELFRDSPKHLTLAGAGDVLSCHTACRDWEIAVEDGVHDHPLDQAVIAKARHLVGRLADYAGEIHALTDVGLKVLLDCNLETVEICQPIGHFRAEEGSEHFFFYTVEHLTQRPYVHGQIVGLGIYLMSKLQNNRPEDIAGLMQDIGIDWSPKAMGLSQDTVRTALSSVEEYVKKESLWYSIINRGVPASFIEEMIGLLIF